MDQFLKKRDEKSTDPCQYKEKCVRKNAHHFIEYAHEHLENIIKENFSRNKNEIENYDIPEELMTNKTVYLDQIKIINDEFSKPSPELSAKRIKIEVQNDTQPDVKPIISPEQIQNAQRSAARQTSSNVLTKLNAAKPYNYFLTTIESSVRTHTDPLSITFQELLDPSLGEIECSVQINYLVELDWLLDQYRQANCLNAPVLILHGDKEIPTKLSQVTTHFVDLEQGTHHTKIMLFGYKDGSMRVIVSTANLRAVDWRNYTQGMWISDRLPPLKSENKAFFDDGESATGFRNDLIIYLEAYDLTHLDPFIERIRNTDFSSVNVCLVTSIPGSFDDWTNDYAHGYCRVEWLLSQHCEPIKNTTPLVVQCSTFGNLANRKDERGWLNEFRNSFRQSNPTGKLPPVQIIYPTFDNVEGSYDGLVGGGCLRYNKTRHNNQRWVKKMMYQWRADARHRTRAMPHLKTYCQCSDNKMFWFILTSANLSKSAWGWKKWKQNEVQVGNYEAGVMFLPKFVTHTKHFSMDASDQTTPVFPKLYDIPLTKYNKNDRPYHQDEALPNDCVTT
ncbi:probable tyrosyl-DNA phosphodiesterase [Contarinia nasturtii]|uniref:probable tyrosyl-DNA phosphodiesterase n=1 Tax=Contarinia nasturtii TaxID=265458 RepID=UPI0012D3AD94|nr:probable tyrosyl-DNA phosphodiesterase [Contarinia nasturtii]